MTEKEIDMEYRARKLTYVLLSYPHGNLFFPGEAARIVKDFYKKPKVDARPTEVNVKL